MNYKEYLRRDLVRYGLSGYKGLGRALVIPGFLYVFFFRKINYRKKGIAVFFYKIILKLLSFMFGFQIPAQTRVGYGLYLGHHGHIIVNPDAIIGNNCALGPGVTIGMDLRGTRRGSPTLGNKIFVGTNAVLIGKIIIGNDVLIAPNSFVNFDVPSHSVVVGNPGRIIPRENATEGYMFHIIED